MRRVHLLHIPKTGGSALVTALASVAPAAGLEIHGHFARLADFAPGENVAFVVRDPVTRFVSGFNSRLRRGMPRNNLDWNPVEREYFPLFPTANALAEALSDPDLAHRQHAVWLLRAIFHVSMPLSFWLGSAAYLQSRGDDILAVLRQEQLADDFERFKELIGIASDIRLPTDLLGSHATPPHFETHLSALAKENVATWYAGDYPVYHAALRMRTAGARDTPS